MRRRKVDRTGRAVAAYRVRYRRRWYRMRASQNRKSFPARYVRSDRRELLTHEPCVVADDQGLTLRTITTFQIAADRVSDTPNILEREFICNYCSPA
jgi:hypothetical protein